MAGFVGYLPSLRVGRQYHACASYTNSYDEKVEFLFRKIDILISIFKAGAVDRSWDTEGHLKFLFGFSRKLCNKTFTELLRS